MTKIAINGFGRIGRLFFRQAFGEKGIEIVAINDLGDAANLAYLLQYDSVYGRFPLEVKVRRGNIVIKNKEIRVTQIKDPSQLPWKELGVDIVVEATGAFETYEASKAHLKAGAKRVVITAPTKDADGRNGAAVLVGVNEEKLRSVKISSNLSCTTNAISPIIAILAEKPGIKKAILSTVHGYTATQNLVDGQVKGSDWRRGRAGALNIVPSTTGAATALARAISSMKNKFDGIAFRVPTIVGSIADITLVTKRKTSPEEINDILTKAAQSPRWKNIMKVVSGQLVSSDILGEPYGAIVDLSFTRVVDGDLVKVLSWYDNEYGYASTLLRHVRKVAGSM